MRISVKIKGVPDSLIMFIAASLLTVGVFAVIDASLQANSITPAINETNILTILAALAVVATLRLIVRVFLKGVIYESIRRGRLTSLVIQPMLLIKYMVAEVLASLIYMVLVIVAVGGVIVVNMIIPDFLMNRILLLGGMGFWSLITPVIAILGLIISWTLVWYIYEREKKVRSILALI